MSLHDAEVVGEGTYGCVHNPSLKCKNAPLISYSNKVSKILTSKDAKTELKEYAKVIKADTHKDYYLGIPENCDVDESNIANIRAIQKCKIGNEALRHLNKYKLLIMKDGGINLEKYAQKVKTWPLTETNKQLCEKFLVETMRLFKGLKVFEDHGIVHHDLKPQNIVYNEQTNRLNFIDFGLMKSRKDIIKEAKQSTYSKAVFHWSFPWELEFINKSDFLNITTVPYIEEQIFNNLQIEIEKRNGSHYEHIKTFFYYSLDRFVTLDKYQKSCQTYITGYGHTITQNMDEMKYETFLDKSIRTIDVFGLGISLNYWLHIAKKFLPSTLFNELDVLYSKMISSELKFRPIINDLLHDMEEILTKNGLLEKYNKKIRHHMVFDNDITTPTFSVDSRVFQKITKPNLALITKTPGSCPENMVKNSRGRCVPIRRASVNNHTLDCPPGKEYRAKTKKCVKKCKLGYIRNEQFKCKRNKTTKKYSTKPLVTELPM